MSEFQIDVDMAANVDLGSKFQPGQFVYVLKGHKRIKRVIGDRFGTGKNYGNILTIGGRSGREEYWEEPWKLEVIAPPSVRPAQENPETEPEDESVQSTQHDTELLEKVYAQLADADVWTSVEEIYQDLKFEYALGDIKSALEQLEKEGKARHSLVGKNEVWQKDVNVSAQVQQEPHQTQKNCSPSTTFAQEWDSASCVQLPSLENSTLLEPVKSMTTAEKSSGSDTPVFQLQETSELEATLQGLQQELQAVRFRVNHFQSVESASELQTNEISSPTSLKELIQSSQTTSVSKMYEESSVAHTNQEEPPEDFLSGFCGSFPGGGICANGKLLAQDTLTLPSPENGSFWLRSPQALPCSSRESRPPGQSKLEIQLRELGLIGSQEVMNPEFLAKGLYSLPSNWANPLDARPATEILGISAKPTEIVSTPVSLPSPSVMSETSKQSEESLKQQFEAVRSTHDEFVWLGPRQYWIKPEWVKMDLGTQCRAQTDQSTVKYYASQMESNLWEWEASPVGLLWNGQQLIPYDGHHRIEAAMMARKTILVTIDEGGLQLAIVKSCGSNKKPSLRRMPEDNRKTIGMLEDLRKQHGDEWLLNIINADLPDEKQFKQLSLRAMEAYTGIPFSTIRDVEKKIKKEKKGESSGRITFTPTESEWDALAAIIDSEGFEKPSDAIRWLIQQFKDG